MSTYRTQVLDANEGVFYARQLEYIKAKTYDVKYAALTYRDLIPISIEGGEGITSITYETYDRVGMAKLINAYAADLPRADIKAKETTVPVKRGASSFAFTIDEIKAAARTGRPLPQRRANAARQAIEELFNRIAWFGIADAGLEGVFSHPNIPRANAPTGDWPTATAAEILGDVNAGFTQIDVDTLGVEQATKLLLPRAQWNLIMTTPLGTNYDRTVAKFIVENSPYISSLDDIKAVNELDGAGTAGVDVAVYYNPNPDKLQFEIPEDINFLDEEVKALERVTPVTATTGGLNVYYPLSMLIQEGI
jgi:hypothetical protein